MRLPRRRTGRLLLAVVTLLAATWGCGGEGTPTDPFDGSFIAGDAEPVDAAPDPDGGPRDAGIEDSGAPRDAAPADADPTDAEPPDAGPDPCLAPPVAEVSAAEARAMAGGLAGQVIDLTGTATAAALECTDLACPPEDPCCNTCIAAVLVDGVRLAGGPCFDPAPLCAGSECAQTCRPPILGIPQVFRGVLSTAAPDLQLLLQSVR